MPPQVRSKAGQPADQVVLGDRRALAGAEAVAGFVELAAGDGLDAPVGDRAGGGVSGVAGGIESERGHGRAWQSHSRRWRSPRGWPLRPASGGQVPSCRGDGPFDVQERDTGGAVAGLGRCGRAGGQGVRARLCDPRRAVLVGFQALFPFLVACLLGEGPGQPQAHPLGVGVTADHPGVVEVEQVGQAGVDVTVVQVGAVGGERAAAGGGEARGPAGGSRCRWRAWARTARSSAAPPP